MEDNLLKTLLFWLLCFFGVMIFLWLIDVGPGGGSGSDGPVKTPDGFGGYYYE